MKNFIIDIETATDEFMRFCDAWEIDFESTTMSEDDKKDYEPLKSKIVKSIMMGRLCINDDENLEYTISEKTKNKNKSGQKITISRPDGATYMAMDRYKDGQSIHKMNAILASMSGKTPEFFSDVDGIDLKPLHAIINLFLAE